MIRMIDPKFRTNKFRYVGQAVMAAIAVTVALAFFDVVYQPVIIASFGASAFIAFTVPHHRMSRPRHLIGGYIVGTIVGCFVHHLTVMPVNDYLIQVALHICAAGLAVMLAMFIMTVTNTEHAPATSLALGFVINDWTFSTVVMVLIGISVISAIQWVMKSRMVDLIE